jgi:Ca-activated chloride channel homolog
MKGQYLIVFLLSIAAFSARAQEKRLVKQGNKLYEQKKYKEAAATYMKAVQRDTTYTPGMFNLGNALYQSKQTDAARNVMAATARTAKDKQEKSGAQYNIGNTYMDEKKWQDAIDYYKQALRNNPQDADAKYNLSYADAMMKKDQKGGGGKNKNDKDKNKDKNKDKQNQDQQKKDQNKDQSKDQQNKDQDKKDQQDKQDQRPQPQPSKLSQKQADQILNALQQDEKKLQDKKQKAKGVPVKVEKDW